MCIPCFERYDCKVQGHRYRKRFVAGGLMSWEELSPNINTFGLQPAATESKVEAMPEE